jgi:flagellar assembly factor FliW
MLLDTARFGSLSYEARDIVLFPEGLIGFEQVHAWILLDEEPLFWLQAIDDRQISLPVVSPFRYVPEYSLALQASQCGPLHLGAAEQAVALVVVSQHERDWTVNLRAPIIIRPDLRLGRQMITPSEHSLQHVLPRAVGRGRKTA